MLSVYYQLSTLWFRVTLHITMKLVLGIIKRIFNRGELPLTNNMKRDLGSLIPNLVSLKSL